ncbi:MULTISPECIES: heavy metal translocating P-type ATPase [Peptoniphilus]|uniref:heavy metal translocating P-type ATPase n=1 Tax=Peptoniphilus TaxID=162289 RepID=UPI0008DA9F98|nr:MULTISPECIES: heavy metal translocating P-type ATPase [Peptoniphilus]MBS6610180.1 cadmium-translocating P-type ATPase [Peptoniphilus harei]MDU2115283.1 heavy metal translocating P-type ATPase [Peptoniphilus lacydonensis]MDU5377927.1 heavy metal translocating P-type ATPase [Peptoniphilus lacydonensis]MDU5436994.1 heavy metal translocating P-type ATPase [Peptoniphilus lacydonensis]MDU5595823.1 heavy metal translocating P-type ATPase [Peptoniphilus rhinitidis]
MNKYTFHLKGLNCANCASKIEKNLSEKNYLKNLRYNFFNDELVFESDRNLDELKKEIQKVVDSIEPGVIVIEDKKELDEHEEEEEEEEDYSIYKSIFVLITLIILNFVNISEKYTFVFYIVLYIIIGFDVVKSSVTKIIKRNFMDERFLMTIASIAAIVSGEYKEAVAVMLFYTVGEIIQDKAVDSSKKSIEEALKLKPDFANLLKDGEIIKVDPINVSVGERIIIKPGEKVPLDGKIIKGVSNVDTSNISGEFAPISLEVGDEITSGFVNLDSSLEVEVTKEYKEGTIANIIDMVKDASTNKAKVEKFITRFAKIYTPIVILLAVVLFIVLIFLKDFTFKNAIYRASIFLVISCPCALAISVPLTIFAGIGSLSKKSIFVKGGNSIEALTDIDSIAFDKTGTVTKGEFSIAEVEAIKEDKNKILEIASAGEMYSTHPLGKAIARSHKTKKIPMHLNNIGGKGIEFDIDGVNYLVGNKKLMDDFNLKLDRKSNSNCIDVFVANTNEKEILGIIKLKDEIKEGVKDSIADLHNRNIKTYMFSGDKENVVAEVAKEAGIDYFKGSLLPEDKVKEIKKIEEDKKLAFVGDGTNDAPSLASAYLGISMASGSDIAIESSDIVLLRNEISSVVTAIDIAKRVKKIAYQNIFIALGVKVLVLVLGAIGYVSMPLAVFADVGVALICILNSLRVFRSK